VSHTSVLIHSFVYSLTIILEANSTPIVGLDSKLNSFRINFERILDFPTPKSPL